MKCFLLISSILFPISHFFFVLLQNMPNYLFRTYKYLQNKLFARNSYGYHVHSPFVFHFTKYVIYEKNPFYKFSEIESVRGSLKKDDRIISVTDFGMGKSGERKIKDIAQKSLKEAKYGQLLYRIANFCKPETVLELGTSLGITTAYLASANTNARCVTMEGCPEIAQIAQENFDILQLKNIQIIVGNIDKKLPDVLADIDKIDVLFFDANHCCEAVLNYFEQCIGKCHEKTILVVDDIYWSKDMAQAWEMIKKHEKVISTIDLFQMGIVFFDTDLSKKHYRMRF
jgi:predicted O-methyltransferase YrrM